MKSISTPPESQGLLEFRVFKNDAGQCRAVRIGFSWAAFFFGPFWCLAVGTWELALLTLIGTLFLAVFLFLIFPVFIVLAPLGMGMLLGKGGNVMLEWKLESLGYQCIARVRADSEEDALAKL